ncbi:putative nucleolar 27S pre-rRNA processing, Urb2/Npa2 [Helianthus debilis subsp. tardiflorus]
MADYQSPRAETSSTTSMKRKKKRKLPDSEIKHEEKASKSSRNIHFNDSVNKPLHTMELLEDSSPWINLQLLLSLQNKNIDAQKKVELAYDYVKLRLNQVEDESTQSSEVVSFERVIIFLNNWVQSTLISSEKKIKVDQLGLSGSCLDYRCWKVFKFCLEEGTKLRLSMSFYRDILKVISCIAKNTEVKDFNDDELALYDTVLDCVSSVFASHGGVSNENLDLWISLVGTVVELVLKVITEKREDTRSIVIILNLTCLVLEPFAKFLRLHPSKKNGFHDFVDRLLEPLLYLLHVTHESVINANHVWVRKLLKLNEEVLCQGLFHSSHIDGFLSLQSLTKYKLSDDGKQKDSKTVIKSYHRHLFDKLGRILAEKKAFALFGVGELFRLYVRCIKRQESVDVTEGRSEQSQRVSALSSEMRKSLFDFFVQVTEPFLGDIDTYLKDGMELGSVLEDVNCTLKSVNSVLVGLIEEEVYVRVDDTSEGACGNFLQLICDKITLLASKLGQIVPLTFDVNNGKRKEVVEMAAKELVLCVNNLLKIDYDVLGSDLESLWLLIFTYGTLGHALTDMQDTSSVISEIIRLGCHVVNLYSELRQVGTSVFALCKAIRRSVSPARDIEVDHPESCRSSLYHESWTNSVRLILCSPELRLSIHNAVKSIPEGQVSLCIQELTTDLSSSLEWMKGNLGNSCQGFKAEVLGSGLSEVYALILDSLMVTSGNSSLVGVSLSDLMTVIRPILSVLISQQEDGVHKFLSEVSGCKAETASTHWIFVFFFRLYLSSRSLYRQAVSLAPPTTSKKMSEVMRDTFTAYSGNEWLEKTEKDDGYFSWISESPVSLPFVIEAISDVYDKENVADMDISPLTYVMNAMVIQRLVDLNRLVNSYEFVIKKNGNEDGIKDKQNKRLQKRLSKLTEEATGLVNVMTGHFSLLKKCELDYPNDTVVAAIDKKSLPCAFWCIVCRNIDIWSMHAAKKKLKMFLSILLQSSLPYASSSFKKFGECNNAVKALNLKTVTGREISFELLSNTMLYEEKFVWKHMASSFCKFLKESVSPLFCNGVDIELQAHPNWPDVLSSLKNRSVVSSNIKKVGSEQEVDPSVEKIYTVCETSFDFLSWMPKQCISSKSFSLYATCILNLERFIVGALLGDNDDRSLRNHYKLLRLFLCCRRTLKNLVVTYCENNIESSQNSLGAIHFDGKFPALWLLESLHSVQHVFSKDENTHVNDLMFSLMDYTSYVFLTLTKGSFVHASHHLISSRKPFQQKTEPTFDQEDSVDASNFVIHVAEALKDHAQTMLTDKSEKTSRSRLLKLSSIIACFQGFLWGLSSTLCHMDARNINLKAIFLRREFKPIDKLKLCIDTFTTFVQKFLCELVLQDDKLLEASRRFHIEDVNMGSVHISNVPVNKLLARENLEEAYFFRQLFIAYSAVLKLNLQTKTSLSTNLVNIFIGMTEFLLSEYSNKPETPSEFTFVFLDGIGKFLEELANHLSSTNPTLSTNVYEKLVDLHLKALGKCISLQQKRATLESHETESTKTVNDPEFAYSSLDDFKSRLRLSFKVYVSKPSELYVSSAVQSIKKALIGLQEGCMANYQIRTESSGGGNVTSVVAAGIDCLDVVLEAITGRKGLSTVKTDILGSVCCLFNIIYHLQSPQIFYKHPVSTTHNRVDPDPGSVVLMCIEVLTKVSGKHALYQMDACHVAQALSIPSTLFQNIFQLTTSKDTSDDKLLDRQYSIELYAACCRMLYTFLRHHKRESVQHIALLQASVSVLLHCLEMVNKAETVQESYLVWGLQEGVKCGAFLRRIYEEIRQQKDVIGQDCRLFLSSYIVVYSGYGPLKAGIRREIDEALRPGVYALIDACSPDDLQYLHTVLGEGPCRNTLANLQHDYKINFQYEGKV